MEKENVLSEKKKYEEGKRGKFWRRKIFFLAKKMKGEGKGGKYHGKGKLLRTDGQVDGN